MDFSQTERNPGKKLAGIAFVILFHALIVYALVTGLARKVVEVIKPQPVEARIIEEVKPPPPKDLPLPPPPPKMAAPPPSFVPPPPYIPPPEVRVQPPPQNTIAAVTNEKPANPVMPAPPAMPAPQPPAATGNASPAPGRVRTAAVVDASACQKPEYPPKSLRNEEQGTVVLQFLIGMDGRVVDSRVEKSSGFRALDNAARAALSLCRFKPGTVDGKPEQSWTKIAYDWKIEE